MSDKKEYSIIINGLTVAIKDVTKLDKALKDLDKTATAGNSISVNATRSAQNRSKALSEEEKAAKRLNETRTKINKVDSETNRLQIEATQALRQRTREVTREVALNNLAEGSIAAMGMQLTNLRNEYERLSEEERNNTEIGGQMLTQIQELDQKYKALRESTGNFRDSVGNYEKALGGLDKLKGGLNEVGGAANNLGVAFGQNSDIMGIFGAITTSTNKAQAELAKIIALVTVAMKLSNAVTQEGTLSVIAKTAAEKISTAQTKARAIAEGLATKGTIAATAAQWLFNAAASANPYVLLALALVAVVSALVSFTSSTDDAAESQKKLNEEQKIWLDYLDAEASSLNLVSNSRIHILERQIKLLTAQGGKSKEIRQLEDEIHKERVLNNARLLGMYHNEVEALEENRGKLKQYHDLMMQVQLAKARGDNKLFIDIDLKGAAKKVSVEDAIDTIQGRMDALNKSIDIAVKLKTEQADLKVAPDILKAQREREDAEEAKRKKEEAKRRAEEAKRRIEEARKNAQERTALELEAQRASEDLKFKLLGKSYEAQKKLIEVDYNRREQDLRTRLKKETNLTVKARQAIKDQIINLEKLKNQELKELNEVRNEKELETTRLLEDQQIALIKGQEARKKAEIKKIYDRQIEDVKHRLATEKDLTENQQKALTSLILGYEEQRSRELEELTTSNISRRVALEMQELEYSLKNSLNKIGDIIKKDKKTGIIDVDKTRDNLGKVNLIYRDYIDDLTSYQKNLKEAHEKTILGLQEGTVEYEEEVFKYEQANAEAIEKIKKAQNDLTENTKEQTNLQINYYKSLIENISRYADIAAQAITSVTDTLNMGLQASIDSLNEQLDNINAKYDDAKKLREQYAKDVGETERQLQSATGATAEALRDQLQTGMHLREEAARGEQRLRKEKEKQEAEIAKKEKAMKRNELISKIAMGVANTAQGVTQALTLMWPLNLIMAGIVGSMGAVQTGIMTNQLTKLQDGGEINGPSHANGGVKVNGYSIEAEGGEFVTNKRSYAKNKELVQFINASNKSLSVADILGVIPETQGAPLTPTDPTNGEDRIIEAIQSMEFKPVVSVTDIIDVTKEVTTVKDLSGF